MNKFGAIFLLACVCLVSAEEFDFEESAQSALNPTDSEETAGLQGKQQIFSDFCLRSRDYVRSDLLATTNNKAADVFALFFRSAEDLGLETLETQKDATERLSEQLRNPDTPVSDASDAIEDGRRQIHDSGNNVARSFFQAITSALAATGTTVGQGVKSRLQAMSEKLGFDTAAAILSNACAKVTQYEDELRTRFAKELEAVSAKDATLASTRFEQVECLTSKRVVKIEGLCRFAAIVKKPIMQILSYRNV